MPSAPPYDSVLDEAAARLSLAASSGVTCAPVRDLIGPTDVVAAYAVQRLLTAQRRSAGATVIGRKIGLTSTAVQAQLGVDQPDFGFLFDDMLVTSGATVPMGTLLQPRIETEVAFVLGAHLEEGPLDDEQVRGAVDYAVAAFEIVDSRITDWDITFADTVADNGSSALFVLGRQRRSLDAFEPVTAEMTMFRGEGATEVVSSGSGAACLGDPVTALAWLARAARDLGDPLRAGEVVLSGALGPMVPVRAGDTFHASVSGLGTVDVSFDTPSTTGAPHEHI